jgi:uncharacterized membrane protein YkvA (DUF1232 family)
MAKTQNKLTRKEKTRIKGRMNNFMMFLPNMFTLLGRLIKDNRVPIAEKALFAAAIVYVIMPLDFIPDVFPFIGQVDDIYLVALTLLRLINRTDASVVREHWSGGGDIVTLADSIAGLAPRLLPKRIARVLSSKVELAPDAGKALLSVTDKSKKQPIVVVRPQIHDDELIEVDSGR